MEEITIYLNQGYIAKIKRRRDVVKLFFKYQHYRLFLTVHIHMKDFKMDFATMYFRDNRFIESKNIDYLITNLPEGFELTENDLRSAFDGAFELYFSLNNLYDYNTSGDFNKLDGDMKNMYSSFDAQLVQYSRQRNQSRWVF